MENDKTSIVNEVNNDNWTNLCARMEKQIQISDYRYAFVKDKDGYGLSIWLENNWAEVSDLTELKVWEYQKIKSYAVAIGWIKEDQDLFI